jgi:hypothetical protein
MSSNNIYRIAECSGKYQAQKLVYTDVKWWQRKRKEWRIIDKNGVIPIKNILNSKIDYDTFEEALSILDLNKQKNDIKFYYF